MNGENRPIGPAPLPDNRPLGGQPGSSPPPPPAYSAGSGQAGGPPLSRGPSLPPSGPVSPPGQGGPAPRSSQSEVGPPPPPPPQIDIHTMASDAESLKSTGGLGTEPKTFSPSDLAKEPIFTSEITSPAGAPHTREMSGRKMGLVAGAAAILVLAAAVGYFFIWPLFSSKETPQVTEVTPPAPLLPVKPTPPPAPISQSFFTKPAASTKEVNLSVLTLAEISSALRTKPGESVATGTVKEVILKVNGTSATSSALLNVFVPGTGLESMLEPLATSFIYYDTKGAWPGYVFKLKSGTNLAASGTSTAKIEQSTNLAALYLTSPGAASKSGFKNGSAAAVNTRYLSFAGGASLNYGWVNNYLVISTSFDGFKKAIELLPSQ